VAVVARVLLDHVRHHPAQAEPAASAESPRVERRRRGDERRVVSYTLITGLLAGVFFGLVLLATHVLPFKTTVGVAISTLIIAALFNPLRRRVQNLVDRRFNRSRYDAEAIVAAFNARLRHTVDLDTVRHDLLGVTENAFQPTHVSVWIAPASAEQRRGRAGEQVDAETP